MKAQYINHERILRMFHMEHYENVNKSVLIFQIHQFRFHEVESG